MSPLPNEQRDSLPDSLKQFLRLKSEALPLPAYCPDCGALLLNITSQFWLDGDDEFWNIPLPCCLQCHPELALRTAIAA
jgi:hypothetical protein